MLWSVDDIPDLTGKTILVTGASNGVGLHAAKQFAHRGAKLIMACRNKEKMASVAASFQTEKPSDIVQMQLDVGDLDSVRSFAREFQKTDIACIDVMLLNAGILRGEYSTSPQGYELTFSTNHLGHWLLTGLLLDYMKHVPDSRIVVVTSPGHRMAGGIDYDVALGKAADRYDGLQIYSESKLANLWFVHALNMKLVAAEAKTIAVPAHPGASTTALLDQAPKTLLLRFAPSLFGWLYQTSEQGSLPLLMAATDPLASRDKYYSPKNWFEMNGQPKPNATKSRVAKDEDKAAELWTKSEELCQFRYSI